MDAVLADSFWAFHSSLDGDRAARLRGDALTWAVAAVDDLVVEAPDDIVDQLVELAERAPSTGGPLKEDASLVKALCYLGAGPIEDLLEQHGERVVDEVDRAARQHERFRYALRAAWFDSKLEPDVAARLRRFGPPP